MLINLVSFTSFHFHPSLPRGTHSQHSLAHHLAGLSSSSSSTPSLRLDTSDDSDASAANVEEEPAGKLGSKGARGGRHHHYSTSTSHDDSSSEQLLSSSDVAPYYRWSLWNLLPWRRHVGVLSHGADVVEGAQHALHVGVSHGADVVEGAQHALHMESSDPRELVRAPMKGFVRMKRGFVRMEGFRPPPPENVVEVVATDVTLLHRPSAPQQVTPVGV